MAKRGKGWQRGAKGGKEGQRVAKRGKGWQRGAKGGKEGQRGCWQRIRRVLSKDAVCTSFKAFSIF